MLVVGIHAPLDWLIGEIFWAGKGGGDPCETYFSTYFTGQPEAQPELRRPAVKGYWLWGVSCVWELLGESLMHSSGKA